MRTPYTALGYAKPGASICGPDRYAGYVVRDPRGQKIGRTEKYFVNGSGEPEYIRVRMGLFGFKTVLIPVQTVAVDKERRTLVLQ
jgi:hypothetical protein